MSPREAARAVVIVALALPFAWSGYRTVHLIAELPALLALFLMLVAAMGRLSKDRPRLPLWRRVLPLVLCLAVPYIGAKTGALVDRLDFRFRRQAHYKHVVEMVEKGEIPSESATTVIPKLPYPYENDARGAIVTRDAARALRVDFFWGRHTSYVYCRQNACTVDQRWKSYRRINEEWLFVWR